jgi:hypothetical protein
MIATKSRTGGGKLVEVDPAETHTSSNIQRLKINHFLHNGKLTKENEDALKKCGVESDHILFVLTFLLK